MHHPVTPQHRRDSASCMSPLSPALLSSPRIRNDREEQYFTPRLPTPQLTRIYQHSPFPVPSQAGLGYRRRPHGYTESPSLLDSSSSSTLLVGSPPTSKTDFLSQYPPGPAGNPKLDNSALQGIWDIYRREAGEYDAAMIQSWTACIDNLVIFSGLFSGVTTTFIIELYKSLRPRHPSSPHPVDDLAMFGYGPHVIRINTMLFTSLGLSLVCASVAMIAKQWIAGYKVELLFSGTGSSEWFHESCRLRQFRYNGLQKYKMCQIIFTTPLLLHLSIWCFCIGIVDFLWTANHTVAIPFTCLCGLTFFFYVGSTVFAVVSPQCPFKTALARLICSLRKGNREQDVLQAEGSKLDKEVLEWLISTSRNQHIYNEAMRALLELRKADPCR